MRFGAGFDFMRGGKLPGLNEGVVQAWLDGETVLGLQGIRCRGLDTLAIDQFCSSAFFEWGRSIWAPTKDRSVFFDEFVITTQPLVPEPASAVLGLAAACALPRPCSRRRVSQWVAGARQLPSAATCSV